MGYDFSMIEKPTDFAGYAPQIPGSPEDFRLDSSSMAAVLEAMDRAGILEDAPEPDLGEVWPPSELDEERAEEIDLFLTEGEEIDEPPTRSELAAYERAQKKLDKLLATPAIRAGAVPSFKFGTNDGWYVLPNECASIASGLNRALADDPRELYPFNPYDEEDARRFAGLLQEWARYNEVASHHKGYRVR